MNDEVILYKKRYGNKKFNEENVSFAIVGYLLFAMDKVQRNEQINDLGAVE